MFSLVIFIITYLHVTEDQGIPKFSKYFILECIIQSNEQSLLVSEQS